jgi:hypothetical protein
MPRLISSELEDEQDEAHDVDAEKKDEVKETLVFSKALAPRVCLVSIS